MDPAKSLPGLLFFCFLWEKMAGEYIEPAVVDFYGRFSYNVKSIMLLLCLSI